jgi:hypothetical protein
MQARNPHRLHERRLLERSRKRFEPGEHVEVWCRAWVSQAAKRPAFQRFAPRWLDFVVLTDRRLLVYTARHFTRRPGDRVIADRLDEIAVTRVDDRARRFRVSAARRPTMLIEFRRLEFGRRVDARRAAAILDARAAQQSPPPAPQPSRPPASGELSMSRVAPDPRGSLLPQRPR